MLLSRIALMCVVPPNLVYAADGEPGALQLSEKNMSTNGLGDVASTSMLLWGDAGQAADLQPPVDVVLAADVAYKEELFQPLAESILALSGPRTTVKSAPCLMTRAAAFPRHSTQLKLKQGDAAWGLRDLVGFTHPSVNPKTQKTSKMPCLQCCL